MAATRSAANAPLGSADWILREFSEISTLCQNELEDFTFSARNEVEWLNEHMADIFSNNQLRLAEILKTPGKLRGKTPRTVRQRSPLKEIRQPLGEVASVDKRFNSPLRQSPNKSPTKSSFKLEACDENARPISNNDPIKKFFNPNHNAGYHGETEDEKEGDILPMQDGEAAKQLVKGDNETQSTGVANENVQLQNVEGRSTEGSFQSAKENQTTEDLSPAMETSSHTEISPEDVQKQAKVSEQLRRESAYGAQEAVQFEHVENVAVNGAVSSIDNDEEMEDVASEDSSPTKTLVRKSSLTFATLPAREPLATKKSMGNRTSSQNGAFNRSSYFGRLTGGKSLGVVRPIDASDDDADNEDQENREPDAAENESDGTSKISKLHSKASTQRLHDRINALGKPPVSRPTKSIPALPPASQPTYPVVPDVRAPNNTKTLEMSTEAEQRPVPETDEEPWIPKTVNAMPATQQERKLQFEDAQIKAKDPTRTDESRQTQFKVFQDTSATPADSRVSTTPTGSPPKHVVDQHGPISASKSKLHSMMQSARGLFSSSAAVSAQAKLEASSMTSPKKAQVEYPSLRETTVPLPAPESRRTRSSTENEEKQKKRDAEAQTTKSQGQNKVEGPLSVVDHMIKEERQPVRQSPRRAAKGAGSQEDSAEEQDDPLTHAMGPPARPRTMLQKPGTARRQIVKPSSQQPTQQKVSIKVGSMAGRRPPLTATSLASASKAPEPARPATAGKKESTTSQSTTASSMTSFKNSVVSAVSKPKALLAAERKKEADEKAAQRKLQQKQEMERRKAAQQEESQRREQERLAAERQKEKERQLAEEQKRHEQKQAMEKKRAEQAARQEQRQREAEQQQQQALKSSTYRSEASMPRPVSRQATLVDFPRPPNAHPSTNGVRPPPKRVWNPDQEDESIRPPPLPQPGQNYQQSQDNKRRKTDDEDIVEQPPKRPTMAPPVRMSTAKHGAKASIFGNYPRAPPPASHHYGGTAQNGTASQPQHSQPQFGAQPVNRPGTAMDMARFQIGAIPFANVPAAVQAQHTATAAPNAFKTPLQPSKFGQTGQAPSTQPQQPKSSPFINGEYLHLDEIPTDSEDEDSDAEADRKANLPEWVLTPNLNSTLVEQETLNPDAVFGPIAPLNMEEMFKGGDKRNQARFRSRTSSANWYASGDRLTEEEIRRDIEAREKMRKDGGWSFGL